MELEAVCTACDSCDTQCRRGVCGDLTRACQALREFPASMYADDAAGSRFADVASRVPGRDKLVSDPSCDEML